MKPILMGLLAICVCAACGGDDNDDNPAASETLAGSYDLLRLTPSGGSAISPPNASGIMTLTENRYSVVASFVTAGSDDVGAGRTDGRVRRIGFEPDAHSRRRRHPIRPGIGWGKYDNHIDFRAGGRTGADVDAGFLQIRRVSAKPIPGQTRDPARRSNGRS